MQFSTLATVAMVAAAGVSASSNDTIVYTTDIVTSYTTYCPEATSVVVGGSTYTVTEATTLTITDCPCTIIKPVTSSSAAPVYTNSTSSAAPVYANSTSSAGSVGAKASATPTAPLTTSSGNKIVALSGAGLAGLLGLAVYVL